MTNPADKAINIASDIMTFCCCILKLLVISNICSAGLPSNITVQGSIMMNGEKVVRGVEGKNITIVCIVESGRPPVETLILSTNGSNITNEGSDRIRYSFIPTKFGNMKLFTCSVYSSLLMNPLSCEIRLDIQYSPVVEIRRKLTKTKLILICNPSGNPANYTFGDWQHWSEFKEHIRNIQGTPNGTLIIREPNNNNKLHDNDGIYTCKTSNGVYGINGRLYQRGSIIIHNGVPPVFVNANKPIQYGKYGEKTNLKVHLYNKYGTIQTTISKRNEILNIHGRQERILTLDMFHGVYITVSGIKITFLLTLDKIDDFTDYTIEACNNKGCNVFTVKVTSHCRPEPPSYVSVFPYARYIKVVWNPGFDGGYKQTCFVEYQQEAQSIWRRSGPIIDNRQVKMITFIHELNPKTLYHVRVVSNNDIGESNKTAVISVMTLDV